jgi:RNA polymerase I-specific transcription initiation factor RRN3
MELLIDRMIQIDSEITVDVDELDEEDLKVLENMPSSDEETDDDLESEDEDEIEDQGQALHEMIVMEESDDELACATAEESRASALARTKSMLDKLDGMIKLLFEFFEDFSSHTVAKNPPSESLSSIYNALLSVFDRIILRTHKCKYTQVTRACIDCLLMRLDFDLLFYIPSFVVL